jgi:DNA helicase II / ATP-dependent DNA helicase PcrA
MQNQDPYCELNPQQRDAVLSGDGPLLVVAGAGSGKTKTLAFRVAHLIATGTDPDRIMLLTFTRRAAKEMLSRAATALGKDSQLASQVWGGTFHAMANRLLRTYGKSISLAPEFTIIDQSDSEDMLDVVRHKRIDTSSKGRFPRKATLLAIYSRKVNSGEELGIILKKLFPWCERWERELKLIFRDYVELKQKRVVLDYDDLLLYWYYLLDNEKTADIIGSRFDHILVDEYQDTNKLQSDILMRMRAIKKNIMAVGDDAQSIYGFRAATIKNMLDFPSLFPGGRIVALEHNYRSTNQILDTTNRLIAQAATRYSKTLFSTRADGALPQLITCKDEEYEADFVVSRVLEHLEQGIALRKQAVLFRAGSHSATLEIALMKKNIPFHKYGGLKFLEAAHVKDFIALIRIVDNLRDEMAWFRVLNLFEGVGPATAGVAFEHLAKNNFDLESLGSFPFPRTVEAQMKKLLVLVRETDGPQSPILSRQLERIASFYAPLLDETYENAKPRHSDIDHMVALSSGYTSRSQFIADLVLDPPVSTSDLAGPPLLDEDYLILSTIHSAKGCEWDAVYLIHAADGCLPSDMSTGSADDIEEELRLSYVAMTRARDFLYVLWPLRFYTVPSGHSDRHVYAQCCRFFSQDVRESMELVAFGEERKEDAPEITGAPIDIRDKLKGLWD